MEDNEGIQTYVSRAEALAILRRWLDCHPSGSQGEPGSYAELHVQMTGHRLSFGCCKCHAERELERLERSLTA